MDTLYRPWQNIQKKARRGLRKNAAKYVEQIQEATSHETTAVRPPTSFH